VRFVRVGCRRTEQRVHIPLSTLFGLDEQPGELAGYGTITADQARQMAAQGTWRRILTDPATRGAHRLRHHRVPAARGAARPGRDPHSRLWFPVLFESCSPR
jgi:hypothetical protein